MLDAKQYEERGIWLRHRREKIDRLSHSLPECKALRRWIREYEPWLDIDVIVEDLAQGCALIVSGMYDPDLALQAEEVMVMHYRRWQRDFVSNKGCCFGGCSARKKEEGVSGLPICKHTGRPCESDELSEVVELIGYINAPISEAKCDLERVE